MSLSGQQLGALVFAEYIASVPTAATRLRENLSTGVTPHNVPETLITAVCTGLLTTLGATPVFDVSAGVLDGVGTPAPVVYSIPGYEAAIASLIATQGWAGVSAYPFARALVGAPLLYLPAVARIVMQPNVGMGTGTGAFTIGSNPQINALATPLTGSITAALVATGKFGQGDVPGAGLNTILAARVPAIASALAIGMATITGVTSYVGTGAAASPVAGIVNGGSFV